MFVRVCVCARLFVWLSVLWCWSVLTRVGAAAVICVGVVVGGVTVGGVSR